MSQIGKHSELDVDEYNELSKYCVKLKKENIKLQQELDEYKSYYKTIGFKDIISQTLCMELPFSINGKTMNGKWYEKIAQKISDKIIKQRKG